jgi:hypothetical protein
VAEKTVSSTSKEALALKVAAEERIVTKKATGRPTTGRGTQIGERWHPADLAAIDAWIASSADNTISRAHAVRRLVALGLSKSNHPSKTQIPSSAKQSAARAAELAENVIDKKMPADAPTGERSVRKRKLLEGPSSFREIRKDRSR